MPDSNATLRYSVYWLLIAVAVGQMTGRILAVNSVDVARLEADKIKTALAETEKKLKASGVAGDELTKQLAERNAELHEKIRLQRPFLSSNDRSRWCAMRALVENGTFVIDDIQAEPTWDTIDMVKHADRDGEMHLYSSKPPLLAMIYSVPYWVVYHLTGKTLATHPYEIGRALLLLFNVLPMIAFFAIIARLVEQYGRTDWDRLFVMTAATLGTFLNTFAVVLNNHTPGAVCVAAGLYAALRIWYDGRRETRYFLIAGFFSAMAFVDEMPALSFLAAMATAVAWCSPRQALVAFAPMVLLVGAAYFGTNYMVHDSLRPPYAHRSETNPDDNWYRFTYDRGPRKNIPSHWSNPQGIDRGEVDPAVYAVNVLVGTHGILSLTPMWLLSVVGVAIWARKREPDRRALALLIGSITVVCIAFYLSRPQNDRNYGGMTSAFRWAFWMIPLWLLAMLPAADAASSSRRWKFVSAILLACSALSAAYPTWNPWTLPWLHNFAVFMELREPFMP